MNKYINNKFYILAGASEDAIMDVVGAPAEYNKGKAVMRSWFLDELRADLQEAYDAGFEEAKEKALYICSEIKDGDEAAWYGADECESSIHNIQPCKETNNE